MDKVERIASFTVDHNTLKEGIYISRTDHGVVTYDLRTRVPNAGDYMDNVTMHTVEHMFATFVRNSAIKNEVIYFGPMGCRTGFYLLVTDKVAPMTVYETAVETLKKIIAHEGEVFGASATECGNYRSLDLSAAKKEAERYLSVLAALPHPTFRYN